ncbi:hypothetical protein [Thermus altitudinis]|nr:hypothetical protein [Thermus altitudinis]
MAERPWPYETAPYPVGEAPAPSTRRDHPSLAHPRLWENHEGVA